MEAPLNYFNALYRVDVSEHIEKKSGFSYVSWPFAVAELRKRYPSATWEVVRFDGLPYLKTEVGYFVEVRVTVEGVPLSQIHPVLDNRNHPVKAPNAFQINTSIQRALVKAIALHGLGLFVYAGEDLPEEASDAKSRNADKDNGSPGALMFRELQPEIQDELRKNAPHIDQSDTPEKALDLIEMTLDNWPDEDRNAIKGGLWYLLSSKTRTAIKKHLQENHQ